MRIYKTLFFMLAGVMLLRGGMEMYSNEVERIVQNERKLLKSEQVLKARNLAKFQVRDYEEKALAYGKMSTPKLILTRIIDRINE